MILTYCIILSIVFIPHRDAEYLPKNPFFSEINTMVCIHGSYLVADSTRETRTDGPFDFVIAIMSPANRCQDCLLKMGIYRKAGVAHYCLQIPKRTPLRLCKRTAIMPLPQPGSGGQIHPPRLSGVGTGSEQDIPLTKVNSVSE